MWATSAAQTTPTASAQGTAALDAVPPPAIATSTAISAVAPHAPTRRRVTVTDGRAVSSGDIGRCSQTSARVQNCETDQVASRTKSVLPSAAVVPGRGEDANDGPPAAVRRGNRADAGALGAGHTTAWRSVHRPGRAGVGTRQFVPRRLGLRGPHRSGA